MTGGQVLSYFEWYCSSAQEPARREGRQKIEKRLGIGLSIAAVAGFVVAASEFGAIAKLLMFALFAFVMSLYYFGPAVLSRVYRVFDPATRPLPLTSEFGEYGKYIGGIFLLAFLGPSFGGWFSSY
jgi:hypothetical protein